MTTARDRRVDGIRRFNRFYTQRIGVLAENYLRTPFTLAESRVLFELAQRERSSPGELAAGLELDPKGYLSRILQRFEQHGLVTRVPAPADRRRVVLELTGSGRAAFAPLDERSQDEIDALLAPLPDELQDRVLAAMDSIPRSARA